MQKPATNSANDHMLDLTEQFLFRAAHMAGQIPLGMRKTTFASTENSPPAVFMAERINLCTLEGAINENGVILHPITGLQLAQLFFAGHDMLEMQKTRASIRAPGTDDHPIIFSLLVDSHDAHQLIINAFASDITAPAVITLQQRSFGVLLHPIGPELAVALH